MIRNLTPHPITLRDSSGADHVLPSEGRAQVTPAKRHSAADSVPGCPVPVEPAQLGGTLDGLPSDAAEGDLIVVSAVVAAALREIAPGLAGLRLDWSESHEATARVYLACTSPGTGPDDRPIRENGQVVAVTRLVWALGDSLRMELRSRLRPAPQTGHGERAAEPITSGGGHTE